MDYELDRLAVAINNCGPKDPLQPDDAEGPQRLYFFGENGFGADAASGSPGDEADDSAPPPGSIEDTVQYARLRQDGSHCQMMINDPRVECKVPRITLTRDDMNGDEWDHLNRPDAVPVEYMNEDLLTLGPPVDDYKLIMMDLYNEKGELCVVWKGRAAPGVLFVEDVSREGPGPWCSELCKVAYEQVATLSTLKSVFVTCVINTDTRPYTKGLWTGRGEKEFLWGTRQYQTMLGTRIGKIVAYFILGAFGQGVKRIPRIVIWWSGSKKDALQMRFDIEDIDSDAPANGTAAPATASTTPFIGTPAPSNDSTPPCNTTT